MLTLRPPVATCQAISRVFSKGVEISRLCCNGLWLIREFKSDPSYPLFEGHGVGGYDPVRKKYTSVWVDSDISTPMTSEGTYDAATRTMTYQATTFSGGKEMRAREVEVWQDDDTRQLTMYMPGPDGKESAGLIITYTRRK